jgi:hypothetical protein
MCLIPFFIGRVVENRRKAAATDAEKLLDDVAGTNSHLGSGVAVPKKSVPSKVLLLLAIPACCDLLGTTLAGIGLLYLNASIFQMLRGSIILFVSIMSRIVFKRRIPPYRALGIFVVVVGLSLVGLSSYLDSHTSTSTTVTPFDVMIGIALVLAGQLFNGIQMIIEEYLLKNHDVPPILVVGTEGTVGLCLMILVMIFMSTTIPGSDFGGVYENALNSFTQVVKQENLCSFCVALSFLSSCVCCQIKNSNFLLFNVILYCFSISVYNFCGLSISKQLSAVHRTLVDASRTVFVWVINLFAFYALNQTSFGESWVTRVVLRIVSLL